MTDTEDQKDIIGDSCPIELFESQLFVDAFVCRKYVDILYSIFCIFMNLYMFIKQKKWKRYTKRYIL